MPNDGSDLFDEVKTPSHGVRTRRWVRWTATAMAVVVVYSNVLAPPLLQAGFWEDRRQAVQTIEGSRGRVGSVNTLALPAPPSPAILVGEHTCAPPLARSTLASLPQLFDTVGSLKNLVPSVERFSLAQPKGFTPPTPPPAPDQHSPSQPATAWSTDLSVLPGSATEAPDLDPRGQALGSHLLGPPLLVSPQHLPRVARWQLSAVPWLQHLPWEWVTLQAIDWPVHAKATMPIVIHLQDVHGHPEAQLHIGRALLQLLAGAGVGKGSLPSPLPSPLEGEGRGEGARRSTPPLLIGIEGASGPFVLEPFRAVPQATIRQHVSEALIREGLLTGPEYAGIVAPRAPLLWGLEEESLYLTNIHVFKRALQLQAHATETLRALRHTINQRKLTIYNPALQAFDTRLTAYQGGTLSLRDYLNFLVEVSRHEDMAPSPLAGEFFDTLWQEVAALESASLDALARTAQEQTLVSLTRSLILAEKLVAFTLTPQEWQDYQRFQTVLTSSSSWEMVGVNPPPSPDWLAPFEAFYRSADQRNHVLVANLLAKAREIPSPPPFIVLVTGGFHTPAIQALLREHQIPCLTLTPRLTAMDSDHRTRYLDAFFPEQIPLSRLFLGEKLSMNPPPALAASTARVGYPGRTELASENYASLTDIEAQLTPLNPADRAQIHTALLALPSVEAIATEPIASSPLKREAQNLTEAQAVSQFTQRLVVNSADPARPSSRLRRLITFRVRVYPKSAHDSPTLQRELATLSRTVSAVSTTEVGDHLLLRAAVPSTRWNHTSFWSSRFIRPHATDTLQVTRQVLSVHFSLVSFPVLFAAVAIVTIFIAPVGVFLSAGGMGVPLLLANHGESVSPRSPLRVAILGASGSMGKELVRQLAAEVTLTAVTRSETAFPSSTTLVRASPYDVATLTELVRNHDWILNFAGVPGSGIAAEDHVTLLAANGFLPGLLAATVRKEGREQKIRILFPSTQRVYSFLKQPVNPQEIPLVFPERLEAWLTSAEHTFMENVSGLVDLEGTEQALRNLATSFLKEHPIPEDIDVYALTKVLGERLTASLPNAVVLRISRTYGNSERSDRLISRLVSQRLAGQTGHLPASRLDLIHYDDFGRFVRRLLVDDQMRHLRFINVAAGAVHAIDAKTIASLVAQLIPGPPVHAEGKDAAPFVSLDTTTFLKYWGESLVSIEEGVRRYIEERLREIIVSEEEQHRARMMLQDVQGETGPLSDVWDGSPWPYLHEGKLHIARHIYCASQVPQFSPEEIRQWLQSHQLHLRYRERLGNGLYVQLILPNGDLLLAPAPPQYPMTSRIPDPVIAFDIGGTSLRAAIVMPDGTFAQQPIRVGTPNFLRNPSLPSHELQKVLIDTIQSTITRLRNAFPHLELRHVSIGFAGPVDRQGVVRFAPTIWGPGGTDYPLLPILESRIPQVQFFVANDMTTTGFRYLPMRKEKRFGILTVGSGVGIRMFDGRHPDKMLNDPDTVIAGEVGHVVVDDSPNALACDCGGRGHIGALTSGRGAERMMQQEAQNDPAGYRTSQLYRLQSDPTKLTAFNLAEAVRLNDPFALKLLDRITDPLAMAIAIINGTVGPDEYIVVGGFGLSMGEAYRQSLVKNLRNRVSKHIPGKTIESWVTLGENDDNNVLIGAAKMAHGLVWRASRLVKERDDEGNVTIHADASKQARQTIIFTQGVFQWKNPVLKNLIRNRHAFVVVDAALTAWLPQINDYCNHWNIPFKTVTARQGEENKSMDVALELIQQAKDFGLDRRSYFIAVGGGALMDVVGFAASIYRRGVPYIRIPTTLLGQIDAGVGVKTGITFRGTKNFIGSFEGPAAVINDLGFLTSLPERQLASGLAEALKAALVRDHDGFIYIETHCPSVLARHFEGPDELPVRRIVEIGLYNHLEELEGDFHETRLQRVLNFGHEFGHKLETSSKGRLTHGEAVALGMVLSTKIGCQRNITPPEVYTRLLNLLVGIGLPVFDELMTVENLWPAVEEWRAHQGGNFGLVVPTAIGRATFVTDITREQLTLAIDELRGAHRVRSGPHDQAIHHAISAMLEARHIVISSIHPQACELIKREAMALGSTNIEWILRSLLAKTSNENVTEDEVKAFFNEGVIKSTIMLFTPMMRPGDMKHSERLKKDIPIKAGNRPYAPAMGEAIASYAVQQMKRYFDLEAWVNDPNFAIVGKSTGGLVLGALISQLLGVPLVTLTKTPFDFTLPDSNGRVIKVKEPHLPENNPLLYSYMAIRPGMHILLVDDESTTGQVHANTVHALGEQGIKTEGGVVLLQSSSRAQVLMDQQKIPYLFLSFMETEDRWKLPVPTFIPFKDVPIANQVGSSPHPSSRDGQAALRLEQYPLITNNGKFFVDHSLRGMSLEITPGLFENIGERIKEEIESIADIQDVRQQCFKRQKTLYIVGTTPSGLYGALAASHTTRLPLLGATDRPQPAGYRGDVVTYVGLDGYTYSIYGVSTGDQVILVTGELTDGEEQTRMIKALQNNNIGVLSHISIVRNTRYDGESALAKLGVPTRSLQVYDADEAVQTVNISENVRSSLIYAVDNLNRLIKKQNPEAEVIKIRALPSSFTRGLMMKGSDIDNMFIYVKGMSQHELGNIYPLFLKWLSRNEVALIDDYAKPPILISDEHVNAEEQRHNVAEFPLIDVFDHGTFRSSAEMAEESNRVVPMRHEKSVARIKLLLHLKELDWFIIRALLKGDGGKNAFYDKEIETAMSDSLTDPLSPSAKRLALELDGSYRQNLTYEVQEPMDFERALYELAKAGLIRIYGDKIVLMWHLHTAFESDRFWTQRIGLTSKQMSSVTLAEVLLRVNERLQQETPPHPSIDGQEAIISDNPLILERLIGVLTRNQTITDSQVETVMTILSNRPPTFVWVAALECAMSHPLTFIPILKQRILDILQKKAAGEWTYWERLYLHKLIHALREAALSHQEQIEPVARFLYDHIVKENEFPCCGIPNMVMRVIIDAIPIIVSRIHDNDLRMAFWEFLQKTRESFVDRLAERATRALQKLGHNFENPLTDSENFANPHEVVDLGTATLERKKVFEELEIRRQQGKPVRYLVADFDDTLLRYIAGKTNVLNPMTGFWLNWLMDHGKVLIITTGSGYKRLYKTALGPSVPVPLRTGRNCLLYTDTGAYLNDKPMPYEDVPLEHKLYVRELLKKAGWKEVVDGRPPRLMFVKKNPNHEERLHVVSNLQSYFRSKHHVYEVTLSQMTRPGNYWAIKIYAISKARSLSHAHILPFQSMVLFDDAGPYGVDRPLVEYTQGGVHVNVGAEIHAAEGMYQLRTKNQQGAQLAIEALVASTILELNAHEVRIRWSDLEKELSDLKVFDASSIETVLEPIRALVNHRSQMESLHTVIPLLYPFPPETVLQVLALGSFIAFLIGLLAILFIKHSQKVSEGSHRDDDPVARSAGGVMALFGFVVGAVDPRSGVVSESTLQARLSPYLNPEPQGKHVSLASLGSFLQAGLLNEHRKSAHLQRQS